MTTDAFRGAARQGMLAGRERDLDAVRSFAARACAFGSGLVIAGDLGAGKTTLLDAVAAEAETAEAKVVRAAGIMHETSISYGRAEPRSPATGGVGRAA
jgi:ABC-type uncharacterized transport system ATPase subunit